MHKTALAINVAFLIERFSRLIVPRPPSTPAARIQFLEGRMGLNLEQPLYAAQRPPAKVEFIRQDKYFLLVESVLSDLH